MTSTKAQDSVVEEKLIKQDQNSPSQFDSQVDKPSKGDLNDSKTSNGKPSAK